MSGSRRRKYLETFNLIPSLVGNRNGVYTQCKTHADCKEQDGKPTYFFGMAGNESLSRFLGGEFF